jgi:hypothetical protein
MADDAKYAAIDKELVIACHCPVPIHSQVYYINDGVVIQPVGPAVTYADPDACLSHKWDTIASESKSYVWGINCGLAPAILTGELPEGTGPTATFIAILNAAGRILRTGGQAIFPGPYDPLKEALIQSMLTHDSLTYKWKVSIKKSNTFPFLLTKIKSDGFLQIHPYLAVFTKIVAGGHRRRNSYRHKQKRRRTSKRRNS